MIFSLTELIVFSIVIVIVSLLSIGNIRLYLANRNLLDTLVQSTLDKVSLQNALNKLSDEYEMISMQETDGFVKFLSESRESAFSYIEEVQASVRELVDAMSAADDALIAKAYSNLVKHMPKEEAND